MMLRRFARLALVPAALAATFTAALTACNDRTDFVANQLVAPDTLVAYSISGTPATYPSALNTVARTTVQITGAADFDFGFDLNPDTTITVIPVRLLVNGYSGSRTVGFQLSAVDFDSLKRAPEGYYRPDTAIIVRPGQTFVTLTNRTDICYYFASPRVYQKTVIDSVNMVTRKISLRQVVDPNCGFRSFLTGLPVN
jgi:hypothetical protein